MLDDYTIRRMEEALGRATHHGLLDPRDVLDLDKIRRNVYEDTRSFGVADIRAMAKQYGAEKVPASRVKAAHALADAYVTEPTGIVHAVVLWKQGGNYSLDDAIKVYKVESAADAFAKREGGNVVVRSFDTATGEQTFGRKNPSDQLPMVRSYLREDKRGRLEYIQNMNLSALQQVMELEDDEDLWLAAAEAKKALLRENPALERLAIYDPRTRGEREVQGYRKGRDWFYESGEPIEVGGVSVTMIKGYRDNPGDTKDWISTEGLKRGLSREYETSFPHEDEYQDAVPVSWIIMDASGKKHGGAYATAEGAWQTIEEFPTYFPAGSHPVAAIWVYKGKTPYSGTEIVPLEDLIEADYELPSEFTRPRRNPSDEPEILIYGLPPGETREYMETILYTKAKTVEEAEKIADLLEREHGATKTRVWVYKGEAPDFASTVGGRKRRNPAESFTAKAVGHTGRVLGSVTSSSIQGAIEKADRELPADAEITVRGEYTSDGTHYGPGGGRAVAVKESGKWRRYNPAKALTAKGERMYQDVKASGSAESPSAVVFAAAKRGVPGLVKKKWAKEHGYPESNPSDDPEILIEYAAVKNENENKPGWVPAVWNNKHVVVYPWHTRSYDQDVALRMARESAEEEAARYTGDWDVSMQERRANPGRHGKPHGYPVAPELSYERAMGGWFVKSDKPVFGLPSGPFKTKKDAEKVGEARLRGETLSATEIIEPGYRPTYKNPYEIHFDKEQAATIADTTAFLRDTLEIDAGNARRIAAEMKKIESRERMGGNPAALLREIDGLADGFGVDGFWPGDDGELSTRPQFGEIPLAEYVNSGDTYSPTVLYDYSEGKFYLTTYGDWVEKYERER
jgi:hypothetical protein